MFYKYEPPKSSKESQDICFIQKPCTTKKYLTEKFGEIKGDFIEIPTGKKLGTHTGHYQYTIGQRKGIGIAAPYPLYVINIDAEKNIVYLGKREDDFRTKLAIKDLNFTYPLKEKEFLKDYEKLEKMQILQKREDKISFDEASYALLIYFVKKEERTLDYIKQVMGI